MNPHTITKRDAIMARMYPRELPSIITNDSGRQAEIRIFNALRDGLPDKYSIFHGVGWLAHIGRDGKLHDGEADFVVLHPFKGLLVIEVKGGQITGEASSGQLFSRDRYGKLHPIDPLHQIKRTRLALREKIKSLPGWDKDWIPVCQMVAFPDCVRTTDLLHPELPQEILLYSSDLNNIQPVINRCFKQWPDDHAGGFTPDEVTKLTDFLGGTFELKRALSADIAAGEAKILRLTEEQCHVLDMLSRNRRVAIQGGAGTGKTLLAIRKALQLASEGFETLLTCFNRLLADHLQHVIGDVPNLTIYNYHRLCHMFAVNAGLLTNDLKEVNVNPDFFKHVLPEKFIEALTKMPEKRFDAIVADEGQDFDPHDWTTLELSLHDEQRDVLYIFHDSHQQLYRNHLQLPEEMMPLVLTRNLRNSRPIFDVAKPYYGDPNLTCEGPDGTPVSWQVVYDSNRLQNDLSSLLHRLIYNEGIAPRDITVLSGKGQETSQIIPLQSVKSTAFRHNLNDPANQVMVETARRFKGLESPVIILTEMENELDNIELLYVALSRARSLLIVLDSERVCQHLQRLS